jgi:hypothetical protein
MMYLDVFSMRKLEGAGGLDELVPISTYGWGWGGGGGGGARRRNQGVGVGHGPNIYKDTKP